MSSTNGVAGRSYSSNISFPVPVSCSTTQYLTTNLPTSLWNCAPCPTGGYCNANNASSILPVTGYWLGGFDSIKLPIFVKCEVAYACQGVDPITGLWQGSLLINNVSLAPGTLPTLDMLAAAFYSETSAACQPEYSGYVCQNCNEGYAKQRSGECSRCRVGIIVWIILVAGLLGIIIVCGGIVYFTLRSRGEPGRPEVALLKVIL